MKLLLSALLYSQLTLARLHQKVGIHYGSYSRCAFHCAINIILVMMMPSSGLFVGNSRVEPHTTRYYSLWQDSEAGAGDEGDADCRALDNPDIWTLL